MLLDRVRERSSICFQQILKKWLTHQPCATTLTVPYATLAGLLRSSALRSVPGLIKDPEDLLEALRADRPSADPRRWFFRDPLLDTDNNLTWALTKMWGSNTEDVLQMLSTKFPDKGLSFRVADEQDD